MAKSTKIFKFMILSVKNYLLYIKHMHAPRRANKNDRIPNVLTFPIGLLAFSYNIVVGRAFRPLPPLLTSLTSLARKLD